MFEKSKMCVYNITNDALYRNPCLQSGGTTVNTCFMDSRDQDIWPCCSVPTSEYWRVSGWTSWVWVWTYSRKNYCPTYIRDDLAKETGTWGGRGVNSYEKWLYVCYMYVQHDTVIIWLFPSKGKPESHSSTSPESWDIYIREITCNRIYWHTYTWGFAWYDLFF